MPLSKILITNPNKIEAKYYIPAGLAMDANKKITMSILNNNLDSEHSRIFMGLVLYLFNFD